MLSHIFLFREETFPLRPMVSCNDSTGFDFIVVWFDRYCRADSCPFVMIELRPCVIVYSGNSTKKCYKVLKMY